MVKFTEEILNGKLYFLCSAYPGKMPFNPDRTKPAHEVIFSRKVKNIIYPNLHFNDVPIVKTTSQKKVGLNLDTKLTFDDHKNEKIRKAMKGVGLLRKLQCFFTTFKSGNYLYILHKTNIWTMDMFHMINLQMQFYSVKLSQFNIMQY